MALKAVKGHPHLWIGILLVLVGYGLALLSAGCSQHLRPTKQRVMVKGASSGSPSNFSSSPLVDTLRNGQNQAAAGPTGNSSASPEPTPALARNLSCANTSSTRIVVQQSGDVLMKHSELDHVAVEGSAACDTGSGKGLTLTASAELIAPIVILGHNRVNYLARCMVGLLKYWLMDASNVVKFPLFISIDAADQRALNFAAALKETAGVQVITDVQDPSKCKSGDCHLTAHFKMLLHLFFSCLKAPRLILLEEDLEVAPDFLSYFAATAPLLTQDPSLWCVSAWNDHGQRGRAVDSTALYRTDILPGLGWMMTRDHALPLIDQWPELYWDDWMREPQIRRGRQCIFPEVSRTYHYGRVGTHMAGDFFNKYLANTKLNIENIDWGKRDLTYLLKDNYAATMQGWLSNATTFNFSEPSDLGSYCDINQAPGANNTADLVISYAWNESDPKEFVNLARQLPGMLDDIRGKRPRASYNGVVVVRCRGRRLFLKPVAVHTDGKG